MLRYFRATIDRSGHERPVCQRCELTQRVVDASGRKVEVFREHLAGLDFYLDLSMVDAARAEHVRTLLQNALKALDKTK
jgi:hypothetical protein